MLPIDKICKHCGTEIVDGLFPRMEHESRCKGYRDDLQAAAIEEEKHWKEIYDAEQKEFHPVFLKMTREERDELLYLHLGGNIIYDSKLNPTVMMGMEGIKRIVDYKQKMKDKYAGSLIVHSIQKELDDSKLNRKQRRQKNK